MTAAYAAVQNFLHTAPLTMKAGENITAGRALKLDSTEGQVVHTTVITDLVIGVAMATVASGEQVPVQVYGVAKCIASGAITLGDQVMPTHAGAGKCVTAGGATAKSFGVALQDASGDGAFVTVLLAAPNVNGVANS